MNANRPIELLHTLALIVLALLVMAMMMGIPFAWRGDFC